jgi:phospholipid N-methyltransferase
MSRDLIGDRLGSGTGIFTRALLAHPTWDKRIKQLKAVEPSEGMRGTFSKLVRDDRIALSEGSFDATGVEDGWADLVVIAQVPCFFLPSGWRATECRNLNRLSIGAQITMQLPWSFLAFSSLQELLLGSGI